MTFHVVIVTDVQPDDTLVEPKPLQILLEDKSEARNRGTEDMTFVTITTTQVHEDAKRHALVLDAIPDMLDHHVHVIVRVAVMLQSPVKLLQRFRDVEDDLFGDEVFRRHRRFPPALYTDRSPDCE